MSARYTDLQITDNIINSLRLLEPDCYHDFRGYYWTLHNNKQSDIIYNHDKITVSKKHVLRGIHGDSVTTKFISCVYGEAYCVVVDNRRYSKTYRNWYWVMLTHTNRKAIVLPPGVGLGYLITSNEASMLYKWSYEGNYPDTNDQFTIKWNNPDIGIHWPISNPLIQQRDA
jgi:dTDP-4-dehydrorhamnose 3,5-epimerase